MWIRDNVSFATVSPRWYSLIKKSGKPVTPQNAEDDEDSDAGMALRRKRRLRWNPIHAIWTSHGTTRRRSSGRSVNNVINRLIRTSLITAVYLSRGADTPPGSVRYNYRLLYRWPSTALVYYEHLVLPNFAASDALRATRVVFARPQQSGSCDVAT